MYCGVAYFCVAYFFVSHISVSRIFVCRTCVCRIFLCRISLCLIFLYFVISADSKELVSVPSCKITFVLYYTFPLYWNSQFLHLIIHKITLSDLKFLVSTMFLHHFSVAILDKCVTVLNLCVTPDSIHSFYKSVVLVLSGKTNLSIHFKANIALIIPESCNLFKPPRVVVKYHNTMLSVSFVFTLGSPLALITLCPM